MAGVIRKDVMIGSENEILLELRRTHSDGSDERLSMALITEADLAIRFTSFVISTQTEPTTIVRDVTNDVIRLKLGTSPTIENLGVGEFSTILNVYADDYPEGVAWSQQLVIRVFAPPEGPAYVPP